MFTTRKTVFVFKKDDSKKLFVSITENIFHDLNVSETNECIVHDSEDFLSSKDSWPEVITLTNKQVNEILSVKNEDFYKELNKKINLPADNFYLKEWYILLKIVDINVSFNIKIQSDKKKIKINWHSNKSNDYGWLYDNKNISGLKINPVYNRKHLLFIEKYIVSLILNELTSKMLSN